MNRTVLLKVAALLVIALTGLGVGYGLHANQYSSSINEVSTDPLSGQEYNVAQIAADNAPNPAVPYFLGTDQLIAAGVSYGDVRYIQDVIAHFVVYEKNIHFGKVSIEAKSLTILSGLGDLDKKYTFTFGINDDASYSANITSNYIKRTIKVALEQSEKTVYVKDFSVVNY